MKELVRERDSAILIYYKSVLEAEGIAVMVKNQNFANMEFGSAPIVPAFYPQLCVMNDEDYDRAMAILKERSKPASDAEVADEWTCENCHEINPGNFDICWSCESTRAE